MYLGEVALKEMRQSLLLVVSDFAIGLVFGVLARQAGLSLMQAHLMSGLVFDGGSQFVAPSLWVPELFTACEMESMIITQIGIT